MEFLVEVTLQFMDKISFLLGAGFSRPAGYPTAWDLKEKITKLRETDFYVDQSGSVVLEFNQVDPCDYTSYCSYKLLLLDLIDSYAKLVQFDYERFFDFLRNQKKSRYGILPLAFRFHYKKKHHIDYDYGTTMMHLLNIFNQIITQLIVDSDGNNAYGDEVLKKPNADHYTQFLNLLEELGKENIIHLHTLNHDLLINKLLNSEWINGEWTDGFILNESPFYGNDGSKDIQLEQFSNLYDAKYNLYKLHGGLDFIPYRKKNGTLDNYIKIKPTIHITSLYKKSTDAEDEPNDITHYHTDFLTGSNSKIIRYKDPIYFENVFKRFESNLKASKVLIIIGYGCNDSEINKILISWSQRSKIYIVSPRPNKNVKRLASKLKAIIIDKKTEELSLTDF